MVTSVQIVEISILRYIPALLAWGIGIALGVLMVRRGSSKAEKLFLSGCALMFAVSIISMLLGSMMPWIQEQRIGAQEIGVIRSLLAGIPSLAGFVCLVWAFWIRFWARRQEPA